MRLNTKLLTAIDEAGLKMLHIARRANIHQSRFSKIIHGHIRANEEEKRAIARVLNINVNEIFE